MKNSFGKRGYAVFSCLVILSISGSFAAESVFEVSKAGKDKAKLLEVFEKVRAFEMVKNTPKRMFIEVSQKIDGKNYLVSHGGMTLAWLKTVDEKNYVDGGKDLIFAEYTDEAKSYTSVLGATKTVRVIQEITPDIPAPITQEEFVARLKNGEVWTLRAGDRKRCDECFGDGKQTSLSGGKDCPTCRGKGEVSHDLIVKWQK